MFFLSPRNIYVIKTVVATLTLKEINNITQKRLFM